MNEDARYVKEAEERYEQGSGLEHDLDAERDLTLDPNAEAESGDSDANVITIGWQVALIPLLLLTIAGGYFVGRMLRGDLPGNAATPVQQEGALSVAPSINGAQPGAPIVITVDASQLQLQGNTGSLGGGIGGGQAQALPRNNHPLIGQTAPEFVMTRLDSGEELAISDLRGQKVMVNFWATWCPPCRYEMPWLEATYQKFKDQGFELLAVDAGERVPPSMVQDTVQRFVDSMQLSFPVLLGDNTYEVQRSYGVYGLPATYIVDEDGVVVHQHSGMYPNAATVDLVVAEQFAETDS